MRGLLLDPLKFGGDRSRGDVTFSFPSITSELLLPVYSFKRDGSTFGSGDRNLASDNLAVETGCWD